MSLTDFVYNGHFIFNTFHILQSQRNIRYQHQVEKQTDFAGNVFASVSLQLHLKAVFFSNSILQLVVETRQVIIIYWFLPNIETKYKQKREQSRGGSPSYLTRISE